MLSVSFLRSARFPLAPVIVAMATCMTPALGQSGDPALSRYDYVGSCGQLLFDPDGFERDRFGGSIAADGEWLLIGSWGDDTACPFDPICTAGSAYFFRRQPDGSYIQWQKVVPDDIRRLDSMGSCVAIEGTTAMVERAGEQYSGSFAAGEILVYTLQDDRWEHTDTIVSAATRPSFGFGGSNFRLSGDWLAAVTAYFDADERPIDPSIEFFRRIDGVWTYQDTITDPLGRPRFDWILDLALLPDGTLAVSDYFDDTLHRDAGIVWIFEPTDGRWQLTQELFPPDGERFYGFSLAADAGRIVVGHAAGSVDGVGGGRIDIFERGSAGWERTHALGLPDQRPSDGLGAHVALDGDRLLTLAPQRESPYPLYPGAWVVFDFDGDAWRQALLRPGPPWGLHGSSIHIEVNDTTAFIGHEQWTPQPDLERVGAVFAYDIACLSCEADLDADGTLTIFDYLTFANLFDTGSTEADLDGDGELTIFDFLAFQAAFDAGCE